jgi:hypothetical protein
MVGAGLLHSAYLLGNFGDGRDGITQSRRNVVAEAIGKEAEQLVHGYTCTKSEEQLANWCATLNLTPHERDLATLQLANLYDDCRDGEPLFATSKRRALGLPWDAAARQAVLGLAEHAVGAVAVAALGGRFQELDAFDLPRCLVNESRPPRRIVPGVAALRQPVVVRYVRSAFRFLRKHRAA